MNVSEVTMEILVQTSCAVALLVTLNSVSMADGPHGGHNRSVGPPACFDSTPHKVSFVRVDHGVYLQILDWGGAHNSDTMVLLTGIGDNAHVYDQFAFQFIDHLHVIGVTRRGYPPSSVSGSPDDPVGYDVDTRARDDIEVLTHFGIDKAIFVGHSLAGSELSAIAVKYPDRVQKLVYLDAFDLSRRFQRPDIPPVPISEAHTRSLQTFLAASERLEDILRPAQAVCLAVQFDERGRIAGSTTPAWVPTAILRAVQEPASGPTDWAKVDAPRLGIFNQPSVQGRLPYYWYLNAEDQREFDQNWPGIVKWYADTIDEFAAEHSGKPKPVVYTLPDAPHYFYINRQAFVVLVMREFLSGKVEP
jgi:pimeloyl-ACP methyl ester carboxylesterase